VSHTNLDQKSVENTSQVLHLNQIVQSLNHIINWVQCFYKFERKSTIHDIWYKAVQTASILPSAQFKMPMYCLHRFSVNYVIICNCKCKCYMNNGGANWNSMRNFSFYILTPHLYLLCNFHVIRLFRSLVSSAKQELSYISKLLIAQFAQVWLLPKYEQNDIPWKWCIMYTCWGISLTHSLIHTHTHTHTHTLSLSLLWTTKYSRSMKKSV
jgi:hypothetical protein